MATYQVKLTQFEGPLELLLELIQKNKLEITEISLAEIADQFIEIMNTGKLGPRELVDFLVVATKLLFLKSKTLLPELSLDGDDSDGLADHLKIYKEFADASRVLEEKLQKRQYAFWGKHSIPQTPKFAPPETISMQILREYYVLVIARLQPVFEIEESVVEKQVTLAEKVVHLQELLRRFKKTSFSTVKKFARSKTELIISFLALLELIKQNEVDAHQDAPFEDILIQKK